MDILILAQTLVQLRYFLLWDFNLQQLFRKKPLLEDIFIIDLQRFLEGRVGSKYYSDNSLDCDSCTNCIFCLELHHYLKALIYLFITAVFGMGSAFIFSQNQKCFRCYILHVLMGVAEYITLFRYLGFNVISVRDL